LLRYGFDLPCYGRPHALAASGGLRPDEKPLAKLGCRDEPSPSADGLDERRDEQKCDLTFCGFCDFEKFKQNPVPWARCCGN